MSDAPYKDRFATFLVALFPGIIVTGVMVLVALLGWLCVSVNAAGISIARIEQRMENTDPKAMTDAINNLSQTRVTKQEIQEMLQRDTPWQHEKHRWELWQKDIERRILANKNILEELSWRATPAKEAPRQ